MPTPLSPQEGLLLQLLVSEGNYREAAERLSNSLSIPVHPARASSVAQLFLAAKESDDSYAVNAAEAALSKCVDGWLNLVSQSNSNSSDKAVEALFTRAGFYAGLKKLDKAVTDFEAVLKLKGITNEKKSAALASIALIKVEQSANGGGASLATESKKLIAEALALSPNANTVSNSKVLNSEKEKRIDELEFPPPSALEQQRKLAAASAVAAAVVIKRDEVIEAALAKKRLEQKRIKAKKQRAKRRAAYIAKIVASGRFSLTGLPTPQTDRWLPKKERDRMRKGSSKLAKNAGKGSYVGASAHQGGSDAAIERSLDVRAKVEAKAAIAAKGGKDTKADKKSAAQAQAELKAAESAEAARKAALAASSAKAKAKGKN
jgi:hypothetical protein